jgi:hypothetical protein
MRVLPLAVAAAGAAALLAGCGGSATAPPATAAAPAGTASAGAKTASVQQYAGVANASVKSIRETWASYEDDGCAIDDSEVRCSAWVMSLDLEAQTLVLSLTGAAKPGVPAYIGAVPDELTALVAETIDKGQALDDSITDDGEPASPGAVFQAGGALQTTLDKWDPYL